MSNHVANNKYAISFLIRYASPSKALIPFKENQAFFW